VTPEIILGAIVLLPTILLMVLRVNAALVFLSLCLGDVLTQFVAADAQSLLNLLSTSHATKPINATDGMIKLVILLIPVVLTILFMIKTVRGRGKLVLNLLPAAGVGMLGGLLVVPLLPAGLSHNVIDSSLWTQVQRAQDLIVGASALVCLLALWMQRPKSGGSGEKKHKGKG
jgi:hypothetical protein